MTILTGPIQEAAKGIEAAPANETKVVRPAVNAKVATQNTKTPAVPGAEPAAEPGTDVSVKRDNNGRVYYVVSDANSGQEILEVPPKAIRDVSQGIEEYLKQEQAKATTHIKVKA